MVDSLHTASLLQLTIASPLRIVEFVMSDFDSGYVDWLNKSKRLLKLKDNVTTWLC
jgi:hypothetical protein